MSVFSNPTIQSTINEFNGTSFGGLVGFEIYSSSGNVYYNVMDYDAGKVYILNDEWKFISSKEFNRPYYMINIGNSLYMTGNYNVWKLDQDLNILINYNPGGDPTYRGISYNPSNGFIYVAAYLNEIQVFNLDLTLIRRVSTEPHQPFSITESSNKLYVGTEEGIILVYQNEILINQFNGCGGTGTFEPVYSILFDPNGYIATSCDEKLYLFSPNSSFTGRSLTTPDNPLYIGFDSKGRFIQISGGQISIYN